MATVEALIVSYNTRDLLETCLRSMAEHPPTRSKLSVAVLDNASIDGTVEMLRENFPDVRLIASDDNLGFGAANNRLADTSEADYLLLLNADTVLTEDLCDPLIDRLEEHPEAVAIGPRLVSLDGTSQASGMRFPSLLFEYANALAWTPLGSRAGLWDPQAIIGAVTKIDLTRPREVDFLWATCWLMRRADIDRHGLFDLRFYMYDEDLDFCLRMRRAGRSLLYEPSVSVVHIGGASSTIALKNEMTRRSRSLYYRIHYGRLAALAFDPGIRWVTRVLAVAGLLRSRVKHGPDEHGSGVRKA